MYSYQDVVKGMKVLKIIMAIHVFRPWSPYTSVTIHLSPYKLFFFWISEARRAIWALFYENRSNLKFSSLYKSMINLWPHKSKTMGPMCKNLVPCRFLDPDEQFDMFLSEIETFLFLTIVYPIGLSAIFKTPLLTFRKSWFW